jgi:hypothetical protein
MHFVKLFEQFCEQKYSIFCYSVYYWQYFMWKLHVQHIDFFRLCFFCCWLGNIVLSYYFCHYIIKMLYIGYWNAHFINIAIIICFVHADKYRTLPYRFVIHKKKKRKENECIAWIENYFENLLQMSFLFANLFSVLREKYEKMKNVCDFKAMINYILLYICHK